MEANIPADASYDKSHWFECQEEEAVHGMHPYPSEIAAGLAEEEISGIAAGGGRGLSRKAAERVLASGLTADSEILHGPVKYVAARVNSIIGKYRNLSAIDSRRRMHANMTAAPSLRGIRAALLRMSACSG